MSATLSCVVLVREARYQRVRGRQVEVSASAEVPARLEFGARELREALRAATADLSERPNRRAGDEWSLAELVRDRLNVYLEHLALDGHVRVRAVEVRSEEGGWRLEQVVSAR